MKTPPPKDDHLASWSASAPLRDRRFLVFVALILFLAAFGLKSEMVGPAQVWALALAIVVVAIPAIVLYLADAGAPSVEHFIPVGVGAVAVAGFATMIPQWWSYLAVALAFGLIFFAAGRLDYLRLQLREKPGHMILQEVVVACIVAGAYLVILFAHFDLPLKLIWIFLISLLGAYRSFRVLGKPLAPQRAFLFALFVGQVVAAVAWALSVYQFIPSEGYFAGMLLLVWYIDRGLIRHTVEQSFNRNVVLEYGVFGLLLAILFYSSSQPPH
jgi:hypothetical protein